MASTASSSASRARIAALTVQPDRATGAADRARLLEQRAQAQAQLRAAREPGGTAGEARNATIQLELEPRRAA